MGGGEGRITGQPVILNAESREFHCGQGVRLPGGIIIGLTYHLLLRTAARLMEAFLQRLEGRWR